MSTTQYNWSYHSIAAAYGLAIVPHSYYVVRLMLATRNKMSTTLPRTNLETWKGKLPAATWESLTKARGAHLNSLEGFPLFAAAMVAGNVAKLPVEDMNSMAAQYFAVRVLYMGLYMGLRNDTLAYARTGAWATSLTIPILGLIRAGRASAEV